MTTTSLVPDNALTLTETSSFTALTISLRTSLPRLAADGMPADEQLRAEAVRLGLNDNVPTQWIYTGISGHPDDAFDLEIALPIAQLAHIFPTNSFAIREIPAFRCVQYTYEGPWANLGEVYDALFTQFYAAGHAYDGRVREVYRVVNLQDQSNCVTDIQISVG